MKRRDFVTTTLGAMAAAYISPSSATNRAATGGFPSELRAISRTGKELTLVRAEVEELAESLRRALLVPSSPRYDEARKIWNGMWDDKRPALIAQCADESDVVNAVNFARTHDLLVAVRGGGHSISGKSVCDGGIVIDLSLMRSVYVDAAAQTASVEGGAHLHDMDRETQAYGLVCPAGVVSHTGVAGLTLGGGIGVLMRRFGLSIDNLESVEIVTADGELRFADKHENPDLFWGVRGGGGNFGVVTRFNYRLHKFGPKVLSAAVLYPDNQAKDMFNHYYDVSENSPRLLHSFAGMSIRESGTALNMLGFTYLGEIEDGAKVLEPLLKMGKPTATFMQPTNYIEMQSRGDAHNAHGRSYYIKGRHLNDYNPTMTDDILERWQHDPRRLNTMRVVRFGGAVADVANDATPWNHRDTVWDIEVGASWENPEDSPEFVDWGREYWDAVDPYTAESFYVNELMGEDQDKVAISYQDNYPRLVQVKNKYDPKNLFRLNANIKPSVNQD
jgi:FAD/FMN-containing dehydrogenase